MTVGPGFQAPIGAVLVDCEVATVPVEELRSRVERLSELGVDIFLVNSKLAESDVRPRDGKGAPGRLFLVGPGEVVQVESRGKSRLEGSGEVHSLPPGLGATYDGAFPEAQLRLTGNASAVLKQLDQVIGVQESFPSPITDPAWRIEIEGFDPVREREVESWFTVSNGRTGTRGSLEEGSDESMAATYLAGLYGKTEDEFPGPELVKLPEWTRLTPGVGAHALDLHAGDALEHRRILDLRQGILFRISQYEFPAGHQVTFRSARFASLAERELLALEAEAHSTGTPVHLANGIPLREASGPVAAVKSKAHNGVIIFDLQARGGGKASLATATTEQGGRLRRLAAVARRLDHRDEEDPREVLVRARREGVPRVRARHRSAWRERWQDADVVVEGDPEAQRALRFAIYHLISAGDPDSQMTSIGARGLTGPGYRGHVFWDTDAFVIPFFIYTHPPTARALISYRHRTLPAARARAAALGWQGALYAWESADTGEETAPLFGVGPDGSRVPILTGLQEHHISADVAWAAWRYWQATQDQQFLAGAAAEILLETARFWASRARRGRDGRHHIVRVIGPDEYHEAVRDNAFTNGMAKWNLERGLEVAELIQRRDSGAWRDLARGLGLRRRELLRWREVAGGLVDGLDPKNLLYEQFAGFFELEDLRADELAPRPFVADLILERGRVRRSQIVKQADAVMLAHMLPELVPREVVRANYRYYEPRTSHGSSLSPAIHATVAARLGRLEEALGYFRMAAAIDLGNRMGNAAQGIHIATMGGLWQAAVMGFGGLMPDGDVLRIDPHLPSQWTRLAFPIRWRGTRVCVAVEKRTVSVTLDGPASVALGGGDSRLLGPGRYVAHNEGEGWGSFEEMDSP